MNSKNSLSHKRNEINSKNCQNQRFQNSGIQPKAYNNLRNAYSKKKAKSQEKQQEL